MIADTSLQCGESLDGCFLAPELKEIEEIEEDAKTSDYKTEIVGKHVLTMVAIHIGAIIGLYQVFTLAYWQTTLWMIATAYFGITSITAGSHRLWTHKSYKANFGIKLFYLIGTTVAMQNDVIDWATDHRSHHKWTDSDADPHNIKRGFFFSHMGWLMVRKHPKFKEMSAKVDMSDLESEPLLVFQRRHYAKLVVLVNLVLIAVPVHYWNENVVVSFFVAAMLRLVMTLHITWLVNSAAHTYGSKPFDTKISPVDNYLQSLMCTGLSRFGVPVEGEFHSNDDRLLRLYGMGVG